MTTEAEPAGLAEARRDIDELIESDDLRGAEQLLRSAVQRWPDRVGLKLKLARAVEQNGDREQACSIVESVVVSLDEVPRWAAQTIGHFGFAITEGVRLDLRDDVITPYMRDHFVNGTYELTECTFLNDVLRSGDVMLEVGGGVGFVSTYAKLRQPSASIVSYEANPALMPVVDRAKHLNGVEFEMRNAMLGAEVGTHNFFVNRAFWASSATHDYGGATTITVPVESVSEVMAERDFTIVVMDIEGGEIELVPLMDFSNVDRFVVETHPNITGTRAVRRMLRRLRKEFGLISQCEEGGVHLLVRQ